jgi:hypothetical protein
MDHSKTALLSLALATGLAVAAGGIQNHRGPEISAGPQAPRSPVRAAVAPARPDLQHWATYRQAAFGYEIQYPNGWQVIEATPRKTNEAQWAGNILLGKEVQKTTFLEKNPGLWQAEFQISVEGNSNGLGLEAWLANNEPQDVTGGSLVQDASDVVIDGRPARKLSVFGFDHEEILIAFSYGPYIIHIDFAGRNPNDPDATVHQEIFTYMIGSLRLGH